MNQKVCPSCGQTLPQERGKRICSDCSTPIRRHDKWHIGSDGKLHHNDCGNPQGTPEPARTMELIPEG
jgi:predicted amidophosphoribosyltransferase